MFFPSLESLKTQGPSSQQASELAEVTRQVGGIRPLHQKDFPSPAKLGFISEDDSGECKDDKKPFEFPDGGWECHKCQNYNFKGRRACFRCKKVKDEQDLEGKPEHMLAGGKKDKKKNDAEGGKDNRANRLKPLGCKQERVGDWTCQRCFNHNFSFREVCNMCYLNHAESNKMLYQQQQNRFMAAQGVPQ